MINEIDMEKIYLIAWFSIWVVSMIGYPAFIGNEKYHKTLNYSEWIGELIFNGFMWYCIYNLIK